MKKYNIKETEQENRATSKKSSATKKKQCKKKKKEIVRHEKITDEDNIQHGESLI